MNRLATQEMIDFQHVMDIYESLGYPENLIIQWASPEPDIKALCEKVSEVKPLNILEVGTFVGVATLFLAASSPESATIHTIDPSLPLKSEMGSLKSNLYDYDLSISTHELSRRAADRANLAHKINWHAGGFSTGSTYSSINTDPSLDVPVVGPDVCEKHGPFDFIFIDGLHYEDAVLSDLELAVKHLKPGGVIALDDTFGCWGPHVRRAIFRFMHSRSDFIFLQSRNWEPLCKVAFLEHYPEGTKNYSIDETYDSDFYERCLDMHSQTVPHIARLIYEKYKPESIMDFGCGAGLWLKEFIKLGVKDVRGVDGSRTAIEQRNRDISEVVDIHDLRKEYRPDKKYDICVCLDVIEHLQPEFEDNLIRSCINSSDTIIFASPPPGQGGDGHVNERPISHWVEKFLEHGYVFFDEIRPGLEGISHVLPETTYQLNTFVVKKVFSPDDILKFKNEYPQLIDILRKKDNRVEDLFLQNLFTGKHLEAAVSKNYKSGIQFNEAFEKVQTVDFEIQSGQILKENGFCYIYCFKTVAGKIYSHMPFYADSVLYENGKPLARGVNSHDEIRNSGEGLYSMWPILVMFSSSDNSDPRINGRVYSIKVPSYIYFMEQLPDETIMKFGL